jgi:hypothetical protein
MARFFSQRDARHVGREINEKGDKTFFLSCNKFGYFILCAEKRKARMERKLKLKRQFDTQYDDGGEGKSSFYDDLKKEVDEQASLNRTEWDGMDDAQRVLYEGFRPGMYVRIEIKVPFERAS